MKKKIIKGFINTGILFSALLLLSSYDFAFFKAFWGINLLQQNQEIPKISVSIFFEFLTAGFLKINSIDDIVFTLFMLVMFFVFTTVFILLLVILDKKFIFWQEGVAIFGGNSIIVGILIYGIYSIFVLISSEYDFVVEMYYKTEIIEWVIQWLI